jgi:hypothetical protein
MLEPQAECFARWIAYPQQLALPERGGLPRTGRSAALRASVQDDATCEELLEKIERLILSAAATS